MSNQFRNIAKLVQLHRLANTVLSQNQLSKKLGYTSGQFISNIERGKCSIPAKNISTLAAELRVTEAEIVAVMVEDYTESLLRHTTTCLPDIMVL